jgi:hypothetical protein
MNKPIVWAVTSEAKALLDSGYKIPERKRFNCTKMQDAQRQAEQVTKEISAEKLTKKQTEEKK